MLGCCEGSECVAHARLDTKRLNAFMKSRARLTRHDDPFVPLSGPYLSIHRSPRYINDIRPIQACLNVRGGSHPRTIDGRALDQSLTSFLLRSSFCTFVLLVPIDRR
jgi:hypothetical protein